MTKKEAEQFYVGLQNPQDTQRGLLAVTADFVKLQRNVEHIKQLRSEKMKILDELRKEVGSIKTSVNKLYSVVPKHGIPHKVEHVEPKKPVHKSKPKEQTKIQKLEAELAAIEQKMQGL